MLRLDEDLFDDIEVAEVIPDVEMDPIELEDTVKDGPQQGPDMGMSNYIMDLITQLYKNIQDFNTAVATAEQHGFSELADVCRGIANEEMTQIGQLQSALSTISPNVENIELGKAEAERIMNCEDDISGIESYLLGESCTKEECPEGDCEDINIEDVEEEI